MPENYVNMGLEATRWGSKKSEREKFKSVLKFKAKVISRIINGNKITKL